MPNLADLPTRGSLAGDEQWVAGTRTLDWLPVGVMPMPGGVESDPPIDTRSVAFAGDIPGGRVALVLGQWGGRWVHAWFLGPEDAAPDEMELVASAQTVVGEQLALLDAPARTPDEVTVVVVAFPGDTAEMLRGHDVDAAGETVENWQDLEMEDGVAVDVVPALGPEQLADGGIWVHSEANRSVQLNPQWSDRTLERPRADLDVEDPRGLMTPVDADLVQQAAQCLVGWSGASAGELGLTLLAAGPVGDSSMERTVLVGATFPSGAETACLVEQLTVEDPGSFVLSTTLVDPLPADDVPLVDEIFAVPNPTSIAVSGPRAGTTAEIHLRDGALLTTVPLVDGAGVAPLPPPVPEYVRILDGSGALLVEAPITEWAE